MPTKLLSQIVLLIFLPLHLVAQLAGDLNTEAVSELDAVQLPSGTFIAVSMELASFGFGYRVVIHRSFDNGFTWSFDRAFEIEGIYTTIGDPVITVDKNGIPYLLFMSSLSDSFNVHLLLYSSEDDGASWQFVSAPYEGAQLADTPQLKIDEQNNFYISYTEFNSFSILPSVTHFIKSEDAGQSWSQPIIFESLNSNSDVGSYMNFSNEDQINLVFNDYIEPFTYYTSSQDKGLTWRQIVEFPNTIAFAVNKIISHPDHDHICVLTHEAHNVTSGIVINYSLDNGVDWNSRLLVPDASMAEGYLDGGNGNIHITYNQIVDDAYSLNYIYSTDGGFSFSDPAVLFSGLVNADPFIFSVTGESQSMILGQDNMFHVTFIDWSDETRVKHVIFEPLDLFTSTQEGIEEMPEVSVFPNPTSDFVNVDLLELGKFTNWSINDMEGKMYKNGLLSSTQEKIDVQALSPGSYFLRLSGEEVIVIKRLLIL